MTIFWRFLAVLFAGFFLSPSEAFALPALEIDEDTHVHHGGLTGFLLMNAEEGVMGEALLEYRPWLLSGIGVLIGAYGTPAHHGIFGWSTRLALHLRSLHPFNILAAFGYDERVLPELRRSFSALVHVSTFAPLAPALVLTGNFYPIEWGHANCGELSFGIAAGLKIHVPNSRMDVFVLAQLHLPDIRNLNTPWHRREEGIEWGVGPFIGIEQIFY